MPSCKAQACCEATRRGSPTRLLLDRVTQSEREAIVEAFFDKGGAILFLAGVCWRCMRKSQRLAVKGLVSTAIHVVITTVMVGLACRLRWEMSSPEERLALLPGGENNLILWA